MTNEVVYDPLDLQHLGESVMRALEERALHPLDDLSRFVGGGVYALYYMGTEGLYSRLGDYNVVAAEHNEPLIPIYAGQASSSRVRTGGVETSARSTKVWDRLSDHRKSIQAADNLHSADFWVRWLRLEPVWVSLGEDVLIGRYTPVWNLLAGGFGNHQPGSGRPGKKISDWDSVHPGRRWVSRELIIPAVAASVAAQIRNHLERTVPDPPNYGEVCG